MRSNQLFGIQIKPQTKSQILEQIKKYIVHPLGFFHIISLNPENLIIARENKTFKEVVEKAQIKIIDGVGVVLAAFIGAVAVGDRFPGVDLMGELIKVAGTQRLRVLLIGGKFNLALQLANCYRQLYPEAKFKGIEGIKKIKKPSASEKNGIFSIVSAYKPHMVFVSFGSPDQELWLDQHKDKFQGMVCMGVGGAFDYEAGRIMRAPGILRKLGLEWLIRLFVQPWRWRRQLRLAKFILLVLREKFSNSVPVHPSGV